MCGIVAVVSEDQAPVRDQVVSATNRLRHRGPDDADVWIEPRGFAGLGHARLSIIDAELGRQPLSNEDGSIHVTVNGEFYGADGIRSELERKGHRFRSRSDSEILPHLYEEFGLESVHQLRGEFAFALWDERRGRLWAARDRFGVKPLFYSQYGRSLKLASEAKSLFAMGVPRAWDLMSVLHQMFFFLMQDRTLFRDVLQVPPGCSLLHENGHVRISRYWDLDYPVDSQDEPALNREDFRESLREAVHSRLCSDFRLAVYLSGGLDSSCVLGIASEREPLLASHVSFAGTALDESAMARRAVNHTGQGSLDVLEVKDEDLVNGFAATVWHGEMIGFNAHGVARYLQSKRVAALGYKVALTGEGADEIFCGYPGFRPDLEAATFTPAWIERVHSERAPFHAILERGLLDHFSFAGMREAFIGQFDRAGQLQGRHPLHQSMYLWMKSVLPNYTLYADRLDMAHGIETRPPFLDHLLWNRVRQLKPRDLIRDGVEKWALREVCAGWVPEEIRWRTKHSFTAPSFGNSTKLRAFVEDELRSPSFRDLPFVQHEAVTGLLDVLRTNSVPGADSVLTMLLSAHLLNQAYRLS
jgi:asparagine synthase (glutamine-hydrolysing)